MIQRIRRFINDTDGLEAVEYAIIGGLITFGILLSLATIGGWVQGVYANVVANVGA